MFEGKGRCTPLVLAVTYINYTRLDKLVRDKHSSLLAKSMSNTEKSFITFSANLEEDL